MNMKKMSLICTLAALGGCTFGGVTPGNDEPSSDSNKSAQQPVSGERVNIPAAQEVFKILAMPRYESSIKTRECAGRVTVGGEIRRLVELRNDLAEVSKLIIKLGDLEFYLAHRNDSVTKMSPKFLELVNRFRTALFSVPLEHQAPVLAEAQEDIDRKRKEIIDQVAELEAELKSIAFEIEENPGLTDLRRRAAELEVDDLIYEKWRKQYLEAMSRRGEFKCASDLDFLPSDEINILLLGRSGAGISSTINILYNHLHSNPFGKRDVIVPLLTHEGVYEVNVDAFKALGISVKPVGRQTEKVTQYSFLYSNKKISLFDVPGLMGNGVADGPSEKAISAMIAQAIGGLAIHRILIVTDHKDINPSRLLGPSVFVFLKRMLPKAFERRINGVYFGGSHKTAEKEYCRQKFSHLLGWSLGGLPSLFVIEGQSFFDPEPEEETKQRLNSRNWMRDQAEVTNMFADLMK